MASLAPNRYSSGFLNASTSAVSTRPVPSSMVKVLPIISAAWASSPRPRAMEKSGAPPVPNRLANAMTMDRMGKVTPTPVSAAEDAPGMWPM